VSRQSGIIKRLHAWCGLEASARVHRGEWTVHDIMFVFLIVDSIEQAHILCIGLIFSYWLIGLYVYIFRARCLVIGFARVDQSRIN
jgi:hypothetical protein